MSILLRLSLLALAGIAGWLAGGISGGFAGAGLDWLLANEPASFTWTLSMIGGVLGMIGAVMWLATRLARTAA
jgi:hypothetical protein